MNTRITFSLISIFAILALVGGATYAYFFDQGTSSNNVFATGTLDLKLTDNNETAQDSVVATFGGTLAPNQCTGNQTLELQNTGTIAALHAEVTVGNVVTDTNNNANPDMHTYLRINVLTYDGG